MSTALLPLHEIESAFEYLFDNHPTCLDPLFDYFESFWMEPMSMKTWNVSNLNVKTNNISEGNIFSNFPILLSIYLSYRLVQPFHTSYR